MSVRAFFGKLMFSEMKYLVRLARKKVLQPEDMPALPKHLDPQSLPFDDNSLDFSGARKLLVSMLRAGKPLIVPALALNLTYIMLNLTKPVLVNNFVKTISGDITNPDSLPLALVLAVLLGSVSFVASLAIQQYFLRSLGAYQVFTNAVNRRIYRHSLMLSQRACSRTQLGDIVNHMSSDSDAISDISMMLGDLTVSVVTVLGVSGLLFYYLGYTAFVSVTLLLLIVPLTRLIAKKFSTLEDVLMKHRDKRVTLMSQALNGIRVVKYFAWEKSVSKEVGGVRKKELSVRRQLARSEALATLSYTAVSTLVLFASLAFHVSRGFSLTPELVFTCVALFAILEDPFGHLSEVIARVANAFVGADRISRFLQQESLKGIQISETLDDKAPGVEIDSLTVRYEDGAPNVLSGVSVRLLAGQSLAVVGKVGAGKSTLLQSLLRELPAAAGSVAFRDWHGRALNPRIAFVPQEAFIINGSLKENILFGEKDDHELLQRALETSGLETDLLELPAGLFTEIGEKGVNLSGGQKQRVSLARSVLQKPALVLLDDPLSAVDVHTESLLVDKLLFGQWQGVTRVVTTHRLAHLHRFDKVLFLHDGRAAACGSLEEILRDCSAFAAFYAESAHTEHASVGLQPAKEKAALRSTNMLPQKESRLTDDEDRAIGAVKSSVYVDYMKALGGTRLRSRMFFLPLLVMGTATAAALPLMQKSWLGLSANAQTGLPFTAPLAHILEPLASNTMQSVLVYGVLGLLTLLGVLANRMLWLERGMSAGRSLHDSMLASVLKAPLRFFDATPAGRIIQRFSRDVEAVDIQLQWSFETTVRCLVNIATALFLILGVLPVMGFAVLPILFFYYMLQRDYRVPAREAKRLDAISRSPRYAHFKETLQGLVVIRAFGKTNLFTQAFYERLHYSQRMFFGHYMLNRWFSSRIPLLGGVISSLSAIAIVFYAHQGKLTPGIAGLVMVYALSLWESLNWAVRIFSEVEAKMTSVERIKYYSSLDQERDVAVQPPLSVDKDWPPHGEIVFDRVVARYAPHLPPVLKEISLRVPAGARVGIIGRTGSGKSTMLQALYRCMELEQGEIRIDGKNIAQVPLEQLRRSLAIIPQDPTLFMGSLRSNLDRYDEYTDAELWLALKNAGLETFVKALPNGLDSAVSESGANLSQGQRQLLCLARALLAKAQIIVMDEATASVDVQTDIMVQEIVRTTCQNATMVIIAHRLGTVADCDLIFELREGRLHRTLDLKKQAEHAPIDA